jgi:hypothetical protein
LYYLCKFCRLKGDGETQNTKGKTMNTETIPMKGSLSGVMVWGSQVELWYKSPTGDSSDCIIHTLPCLNETQAQVIADLHRKVWGLK